jgi:hypothetical protein
MTTWNFLVYREGLEKRPPVRYSNFTWDDIYRLLPAISDTVEHPIVRIEIVRAPAAAGSTDSASAGA